MHDFDCPARSGRLDRCASNLCVCFAENIISVMKCNREVTLGEILNARMGHRTVCRDISEQVTQESIPSPGMPCSSATKTRLRPSDKRVALHPRPDCCDSPHAESALFQVEREGYQWATRRRGYSIARHRRFDWIGPFFMRFNRGWRHILSQ